jgi:SAM-dependent methyltransferase
MTAAQLETARAHVGALTSTLGYPQPNLKFVEGMIEFLAAAGVAPESMDLIISNCVINLSPDKAAVVQSCYESLRPGGELYFSDVYCDRRLPQSVREDDVMLGECLGGALYVEDFKRICHKVKGLEPTPLLGAPAAW